MSEPTNEPPLVTRPPEPPPAPPSAPRKPRPGFVEAVCWCLVFLAGQFFGAIVGVLLVFGAYALVAPEAGKFFDEQLDGLGRSMDARAPAADRPPVPFEIGQSLAWGMLAAQFVSLGIILVVVPRRVGRDWKRQLGVRRPSWLHILLVVLLVPGFMIVAEGIQALIVQTTGLKQPAATEVLTGVFKQFPWALTALAVAIGPGVVEEFWCRGFLGRGLCARYGLAAGMLLTSVLFGALHIVPSHVFITAVMGLYLHFVYLATRCIWMPVLLHALNNGIAVFATLTGLVVQLEADPQGLTRVVYLTSFALVLFASIALWTSRAEEQPLTTAAAEQPDWKPEYPGISSPPPGVNVRLGNDYVSPAALMFTLVAFAALVYLLSR